MVSLTENKSPVNSGATKYRTFSVHTIRFVLGICVIVAGLSASLNALNSASIKRNAMSTTDRTTYAYSMQNNKRKQKHANETAAVKWIQGNTVTDGQSSSRATIFSDKLATYNATPSGWWPTDEWLKQCATEESTKQEEAGNKNNFVIQTGWQNYWLGDCIKMCHACGDFPDSLASLYSEMACQEHNMPHKKGGNETVIDRILQLREDAPGFVQPEDDEIVVHIR